MRLKRLGTGLPLLVAAAALARGQSAIHLPSQARQMDFSGFPSTKPVRTVTSLPGSCESGEVVGVTSGSAAGLHYCTSEGIWKAAGAIPNAGQSFTSQTQVAITHNQGTMNVLVSCYDESAAQIEPDRVVVEGTNAVRVYFGRAQSGNCVVNTINGGGGGSSSGGGTNPTGTGLQAWDGTAWQARSLSAGSTKVSVVNGAGTSGNPTVDVVEGNLSLANLGGSLSAGQIPQLDASKIGSGVMAAARLGSGTPSSTVYLRGDGTWATPISSGGGAVVTGVGLTGDGSSGNPLRIDSSGGVAAQVLYSANLTGWGSVAAASCGEKNITAAGVQSGDAIAPVWPLLQTGLSGMMYATENLIVVRLCNVTGSDIVVGDGLAFAGRVIRGF